MNRTLVISIAACVTVLAGCSHTITGADGSKVTLNGGGPTVVTGADGSKAVINGNQVDVTGAHGEKETITSNGNNTNMTMKDKDGTTATYSQQGNSAQFKDSKGNSMETNAAVSEKDLGVPFYPGSTESQGSMKAMDANGKGLVTSLRTTTDDGAKVLAFYSDKLGKPKATSTMATLTSASWEQPDNKKVTLMVDGSASPAKITLMVEIKK
jgi:hypothetical protein